MFSGRVDVLNFSFENKTGVTVCSLSRKTLENDFLQWAATVIVNIVFADFHCELRHQQDWVFWRKGCQLSSGHRPKAHKFCYCPFFSPFVFKTPDCPALITGDSGEIDLHCISLLDWIVNSIPNWNMSKIEEPINEAFQMVSINRTKECISIHSSKGDSDYLNVTGPNELKAFTVGIRCTEQRGEDKSIVLELPTPLSRDIVRTDNVPIFL